MNEFTEPVGQEELDRMVDGELTDEEQRMLLSRLEASPENWKRLALAYVEAQMWQTTFRQTVPDAGAVPAPASTIVDAQSQTADTHGQRVRKLASVLTSVTVAVLLVSVGFGLGSWLNDRDRTFGEGHIAGVDQSESGLEVADPEAAPTFETVVVNDEPAPEPETVNPSVVQFVVHDGRSDEAQFVNVPFHDDSVPLDEVFNVSETSVPENVREVLQQTGHEIVEEQGFLPVALPDGRQVVFPVNQVRVRNMARIYQ